MSYIYGTVKVNDTLETYKKHFINKFPIAHNKL